jgi:hypothetical protein
LDQQQLQIARAALWHQTAALGPSVPDPSAPSAPLRTFDAAAQWLDDIGFCLFLPRHTQLPAPAPSFVEACLGAQSITPAPAAIAEATELLTRLVGERRIVPLNLLGTFSEQPDFLVTPEVLHWVAAVRGDRQWKTAPGGRTSPIVLRTFEALDREGELTAIEVREIVGREITEAAALRALMELWTGLRAMPIAAQGEPTRWMLLKNRFAAELATGANTAQTTALSALLSLYLRSAVAATAEEVEIFLSPLTARSRIREVLHGMLATRQIASTPVASHTQLFVEGSLPETAPAPEPEPPRQIPARTPSSAVPKPPARKGPRPTRWELPAREPRPPADQSPPWQKKPAAAHRPQTASDRQRGATRPSEGKRQGFTRGFGQRSGGSGPRPGKAGAKPWQRRSDSFRPKPFRDRPVRPENREAPSDRPMPEGRPGPADRPARKAPWRGNNARPAPFGKNRKAEGDRPGSTDRPARKAPWRGNNARPAPFVKNRKAEGERPRSTDRPARKAPWRGSSARPAPFAKNRKAEGDHPRREQPRGPVPFSKDRKSEGQSPARRPWRDRPAPRGDRPQRTPSPGETRPDRPPRPFRPAKPFSGKPGHSTGRADRPRRPGPPKNNFRKPSPAERKPRKNRSQEETPE